MEEMNHGHRKSQSTTKKKKPKRTEGSSKAENPPGQRLFKAALLHRADNGRNHAPYRTGKISRTFLVKTSCRQTRWMHPSFKFAHALRRPGDRRRSRSRSIRRTCRFCSPFSSCRTTIVIMVVAGERRLRAAKLAGLDRIPARVLSTNDKATHEIALRENLDRVDLHPLEEGEGYVSLLEAQAYTSHEGIAKAFGKPKSRITECIGFTRLPETTKQELLRYVSA